MATGPIPAMSDRAGSLTVRAERHERAPEGSTTEFRYGSFARQVALPPGSNPHDVPASCHNGILTVRIGMEPEHKVGSRPIDVQIEP